MMELYIKNMVCARCIMVVRDIVESEGLQPDAVELGVVTLKQAPTAQQMQRVAHKLQAVGFEILEDQKKKLVEQIKAIVIEHIDKEDRDKNFSNIISSALHKEYSQISRLFSEAEGITLEKYIIDQKLEKVKELLAYGELNLSEIAFRLGYSSVAHLSAQFKKNTGFSPTAFRSQKGHQRRPLDSV